MPALVATEGALRGQEFPVRKTSVMGRSFDAEIRIDDLSVSRRHARITVAGAACSIEDLGSGNGTFLNNEPVKAPTPLKDGDVLRLSGNVFQFQADAAPAPKGVRLSDTGAAKPPPILETLNVKATMMDLVLAPEGHEAAELFEATRRLRTVLEISNAVQTHLDLDALLGDIMDRLLGVFPQADRGFIMLKEDEGEGLISHVARQRGQTAPPAITTSRSIIDQAIQGRMGILSADAMSDQRFAAAVSVMNFQIRSMMCAPLIANDQPLGIIHLDTTRQDRQFTRDDLDLLTAVANQAALTIAMARMHKKLMHQQRMERDLQLARQVQESFLPRQLPELPGIEFCASYKAALEVGGDFYNFVALADGRLALVVGDVSGKGIPAAMVMAQMTSDVRSFVRDNPDPGSVARRLNDEQCARNSDGFVTLIYGVLDPAARALTLANAAHPPPVLRKANGEVRDLQSCENFPIGAVENSEFQADTVSLESGDILCLFTDGITEAMNAQKDLYGSERLHAALAQPAASPREAMDHLLTDVQKFVAGAYQSDDLTVVCFQVK